MNYKHKNGMIAEWNGGKYGIPHYHIISTDFGKKINITIRPIPLNDILDFGFTPVDQKEDKCNHERSNEILTSNPPQRKCKNCGHTEYLYNNSERTIGKREPLLPQCNHSGPLGCGKCSTTGPLMNKSYSNIIKKEDVLQQTGNLSIIKAIDTIKEDILKEPIPKSLIDSGIIKEDYKHQSNIGFSTDSLKIMEEAYKQAHSNTKYEDVDSIIKQLEQSIRDNPDKKIFIVDITKKEEKDDRFIVDITKNI